MDRCHYCAWSGGKHDDACPSSVKSNMAFWRAGWTAGRSGKERALGYGDHPAYNLGYLRGEVALEEAQNS
jgi:hypothetical protein